MVLLVQIKLFELFELPEVLELFELCVSYVCEVFKMGCLTRIAGQVKLAVIKSRFYLLFFYLFLPVSRQD